MPKTNRADARTSPWPTPSAFYPLQQYLIERPGGRLQSLTVAWDNRAKADGGQRWFSLYPGQRFTPDDALHWTGRSQNWNGMCAQCHSGNLKKGYDASQDSFASTWSELSVGCQSCHGPGAQHLAWAKLPTAQRQLANNAGARGLQVDFGARAKGYEVDQCARCHAQQETLGVGSQPGKSLVDSAYPTLLTPGAIMPMASNRLRCSSMAPSCRARCTPPA